MPEVERELRSDCPKCHVPEWVTDTGQHLTIFVCSQCGKSWTIRFRPDPEPLPPDREANRVRTIQEVSTGFMNLIGRYPFKEHPHILRANQSALDTVNYLFGFEGCKTVMVGRRK